MISLRFIRFGRLPRYLLSIEVSEPVRNTHLTLADSFRRFDPEHVERIDGLAVFARRLVRHGSVEVDIVGIQRIVRLHLADLHSVLPPFDSTPFVIVRPNVGHHVFAAGACRRIDLHLVVAIFATAEIVPRNLFAVDIDDEITLRRAVIVEQTVQAQCPRGLGDGDRGEVVDIVVPLGFARIKKRISL